MFILAACMRGSFRSLGAGEAEREGAADEAAVTVSEGEAEASTVEFLRELAALLARLLVREASRRFSAVMRKGAMKARSAGCILGVFLFDIS